ncbi:glycosyltransferase family 4 protein [Hyphomicrobium sp. ghe19]|uniref:glycosyltransferase family 4 protein n=1 Tax=Hyphomicrobium sp. ghe19 TaxID=2682968 RepID=UPI0013676850|nr:GDP-mannose-dependent alpha-(1-6)-phosphatidylinositol monomannoside mannosyltransferase [Hyphomicrobium sp. ghe19]
MPRLAILSSHPIQYYGPLFRELAKQLDLHIFFAHRATPQQQARAGFEKAFEWDVDITGGYEHSFLSNVSRRPGTGHFSGCDTPEIRHRLRNGGFDALLVMGWHLKAYLQGLLASKRLGMPVLVRGDSHLNTPRSNLKTVTKALVYPGLLRRFDAALYVGRRSRAYYEHYLYPKRRLFFSPHAVDTNWFASRATTEAGARLRQRLGIRSDTPIVLFAGKLVPFKRPLDLVEAVMICRQQGLPLEILVAGDGPLSRELVEAAATAGIRLHMLGFCNQSEMPAVYSAADCLALPSNGCETWGLVANEALACGRPIIVSEECGCAPDLARDGIVGRTFPMGNTRSFADALAERVAKRPKPDQLASISRAYSLEAAASGIRGAFDWVLSERNRGQRARIL